MEASLAAGDTCVLGWRLDRAHRAALLEQLPSRYPTSVADHVTLQAVAAEDAPLPPAVVCEIIGEADDGAGVQAMVVSIDGFTGRPDGSTFHITWSLDKTKGRRAVESNAVIASCGWKPLPQPIPVVVHPARFP